MTLAVWPTQLPLPEQSGYAIQHVSPTQRTTMVSGRARQRRVYTSVPSNVAVQWFLTEQQAQVFEVWFKYSITDGADWFLCTLKTPLGIMPYECRFNGIYEGPVLTSFNKWTFSATLEIRERQTLTSNELFDIQGIIDSEIFDITMNQKWPLVIDSKIFDITMNQKWPLA